MLRVLQSGEAYNKFIEFIEYQHGVLEDMEISDETIPIVAEKSGVITKIDAYKISEVSCKLGAGKLNIEDEIDHSVGVLLNKQVGDKVEIGDTICTLYVHGVKEIFDIADAFTIEEEEKEEK